MSEFKRQLQLKSLLEKKSVLFLGSRATGKSFLIREQLGQEAIIFDLLRSDLYLRLSTHPWELENLIAAQQATSDKLIVIDEIQKIPMLLDEVHRLIESKGRRFLLTGSSARKLKYGHANLLAGRAWPAHLYPLSWSEIPEFDLNRYLHVGGLPAIYPSDSPSEELHAYAHTYLYEEIQAEGLVRKLPQFSRFLKTAALMNGQLINFAKVANDTGVPASTIREYYSILDDTLIGFMLPSWIQSQKRKAITTGKFYLFDTGVTRILAGTEILDRNSDLYGRSFEHWIGLELLSYLSYRRKTDQLAFWRSKSSLEVDFIVGDHTAIETKATQKITTHDLKGLKALQEENVFKNLILVSQDPIAANYGDIRCMPWQQFMQLLWDEQIF